MSRVRIPSLAFFKVRPDVEFSVPADGRQCGQVSPAKRYMYRFGSRILYRTMPKTNRPPAYRQKKSRNLAVVTIKGRDHYLGRYGSPESQARYAELIAAWSAKRDSHGEPAAPPIGESAPQGVTVAAVILQYLKHAEVYYRKNGEPTGELRNIIASLKPLTALCGRTLASDFKPANLESVREQMIETGLSRGVINSRVSRIKRAFRWATKVGLVNGSVYHGLTAIDGLKRGRSAARETEPVAPVAETDVAIACDHMNPTIRAMVQVQLLAAMRPQEIRLMRTRDIAKGEVWEYRPSRHKTEHHGHVRRIALGPRAQAILEPFLKPDRPDEYLFRPLDAEASRRAELRRKRITPLTPSQRARSRKKSPIRTPGQFYDKNTYNRAISRACDKASVARWHPHQLRHTTATKIRRQFGLEAASIVLGHRHGVVTEVYAESDFGRAVAVMREIG